jgi:hypothetical protein
MKKTGKSLREVYQERARREEDRRPKSLTSAAHADMWGSAPPGAWGSPESTKGKKRGGRGSLQSAGMPGNEESDLPRRGPKAKRTRI